MSFQSKWSVVRSQVKSKSFKHNSLALIIGAALSANAFAGFPTLYGKIHLTANQYDLERINFSSTAPVTGATGTTTELDTFALESTGSRLGVQGDFDATSSVQVFYRIEYGIDVDNGTNANGRELTQRNIFGGFRGSWGSIFAGKNDSPLKTLQTNPVLRTDLDRFNDSPLGDIGTYIVGENRPDNVIQYTSPIWFGGLEINIAAIQGEETGVPVKNAQGVVTSKQDDNGFASGKSASITYGKAKWYVGVGVDSNISTTDAIRAVGEFTVGPVKIGGIYQTAEAHEEGVDSLGGLTTFVGTAGGATNPLTEWDGVAANNAFKEQDGFIVNAQWKIAGPWVAKIQYANSSTTPTNTSFKDVDLEGVIVGLDYNFNPNARVFATVASVEVEGDEKISTKATTDTASAIGLDFRF